MITSKERFLKLVTEKDTKTLSKAKERIKNRDWLRESQEIALKVLERLEELNWSRKRLAEEMGVTKQQISKWVRGKENLTLTTQIKLQQVLDIPILATFYERKWEDIIAEFEANVDIELTYDTLSSKSQYTYQEKYIEMNHQVVEEEHVSSLKIA